MDGRTDVVQISGKRQLFGARTAADRFVRFEDDDAQAATSEHDRGGKAVRAGPDDDRINRWMFDRHEAGGATLVAPDGIEPPTCCV